jgi:hypothetical protein
MAFDGPWGAAHIQRLEFLKESTGVEVADHTQVCLAVTVTAKAEIVRFAIWADAAMLIRLHGIHGHYSIRQVVIDNDPARTNVPSLDF